MFSNTVGERQMNEERVMPDFEEWAEQIINARWGVPKASPKYIAWIASELHDVFAKGYALGRQIERLKQRRDSDE